MTFLRRVAEGLSWRRWVWAVGLSALLPLTGIYSTAYSWSYARYFGLLPWFLLFGGITLVCVAIAEAATPRRPVPTRAYLAAIVATAAVASALGAAFPRALAEARSPPPLSIVNQRSFDRAGRPASNPAVEYALFGALNVGFYALLVVLTYSRLQRVKLVARALSEADMAREESARRASAARLEAARIAVDPDDVIARLEQIERSYDRDALQADAMLDDLIAQLRASIPRVREARARFAP